MKVTLTASTDVSVLVWREDDSYCARPLAAATDPQICLGVDLFEVLAELTGLDLDDETQAREAVSLAEQAQRRLAAASHGDEPEQRGDQQRCS